MCHDHHWRKSRRFTLAIAQTHTEIDVNRLWVRQTRSIFIIKRAFELFALITFHFSPLHFAAFPSLFRALLYVGLIKIVCDTDKKYSSILNHNIFPFELCEITSHTEWFRSVLCIIYICNSHSIRWQCIARFVGRQAVESEVKCELR